MMECMFTFPNLKKKTKINKQPNFIRNKPYKYFKNELFIYNILYSYLL